MTNRKNFLSLLASVPAAFSVLRPLKAPAAAAAALVTPPNNNHLQVVGKIATAFDSIPETELARVRSLTLAPLFVIDPLESGALARYRKAHYRAALLIGRVNEAPVYIMEGRDFLIPTMAFDESTNWDLALLNMLDLSVPRFCTQRATDIPYLCTPSGHYVDAQRGNSPTYTQQHAFDSRVSREQIRSITRELWDAGVAKLHYHDFDLRHVVLTSRLAETLMKSGITLHSSAVEFHLIDDIRNRASGHHVAYLTAANEYVGVIPVRYGYPRIAIEKGESNKNDEPLKVTRHSYDLISEIAPNKRLDIGAAIINPVATVKIVFPFTIDPEV